MHRLLVIVISGLSLSLAQAQTTSLRQQRIHAGDIAELIIEYEASIPSLYAIDTSPLEADFRLLGTSSLVSRLSDSTQTRYRMQWRVNMVPRRDGRLRIPALGFGDNQSDVLWLEVVKPDAALARQKILVEMEADPIDPYPGQQTRVVMRLLHNTAMLDGSLQEPENGLARAYRSGRDNRYQARHADESFSIIERSILLTPASSGEQVIAPASFRGVIAPPDASAGGVRQRQQRYIYRESEALQLRVRNLPPGFDAAHWLPAANLELELAWDEMPQPLRVGDSLGVTLTLRASGLPGDALPAGLLLRDSEQFRIYADQPDRSTRVVGKVQDAQLNGRLQQRYAIIVRQAGELLLPPLHLPWWDVSRDEARMATLQGTRLTVVSASPAFDGAAVAEGAGRVAAKPGGLPFRQVLDRWPWLIAILSLAAFASLVFTARDASIRPGKRPGRAAYRRRCLRRLKRACLGNNAAAAQRALIVWGRIHWRDPHINGLRSIEGHAGSREWREQLRKLDAALFAATPPQYWEGRDLWQLVRSNSRGGTGRASAADSSLPGLYPRQA